MSATESTLWAMLSVATSFVVGAVAGFFTANPIIGVVVGAAIGVALGSVAAGYIISEHYDVNFNRLKTALILIVGSAVAGAAGGFMGQEIGTWYSYILETEGGFYGINWCPTLLIVGTPITVLSGLEGLIYYTTY